MVLVLSKEDGPSTTQIWGPSTSQRGGPSTTLRGWSKYYPKRVVQVLPKVVDVVLTNEGVLSTFPKRVVQVIPEEGGPTNHHSGWSK